MISDVLGTSGARILRALARGEIDPAQLAAPADDRIRATPEERGPLNSRKPFPKINDPVCFAAISAGFWGLTPLNGIQWGSLSGHIISNQRANIAYLPMDRG